MKITKSQIIIILLVALLIVTLMIIGLGQYERYQESKLTDISSTINSSFVNGTQFGIDNLAIYLVQNQEFPKLKFANGNYSGFDLIPLEEKCSKN